jgi:uncharacterized membrane protein YcaP (DUF421 family)
MQDIDMEFFDWLIGKDGEDLNALQMGLRAVIIFLSALLMLKIGNKRFLGRTTAFDFLLGIIIGSVLSRAITGNAPFFPSIAASFVLIGIHWLFGAIALKSSFFGKLVKGRTRPIIENGKINLKEMKKANLSKGDLEMEMRSETGSDNLDEIKYAYLERTGKISFLKYPSDPKVIDVKVEDGVQTIKIKIE